MTEEPQSAAEELTGHEPATPRRTRALSIDVLRGSAILLVMFRHHEVTSWLHRMGWIGVDLFFVLSGYLVSGLLFKEAALHGNIHPWRFLIRRGFKIYPTFYALLPLAAWVNIQLGYWHPIGLLSELIFMQNYLFGFGWWPLTITWSLAVEEHFYLLLSIGLWMAARRGRVGRQSFPRTLIALMVLCLGLRLFSHHVFPLVITRYVDDAHFTNTHFRYDALLCGVLIAWAQQFRAQVAHQVMGRLRPWVWPVIIALLAWTPFIESTTSTFTMTWGFCCTYLAFGSLLAHVVFNVRRFPDNALTRSIGAIGQWSYVIYLVHALVQAWFIKLPWVISLAAGSAPVITLIYFAVSIAAGAVISMTWERYFLAWRDRRFPSRHLA